MLCIEFGNVFGIKTMDRPEFQDWLSAANLPALRPRRRGSEGHGARAQALSLQIMRPNLQRGDRNTAARAAQEAALAGIRGIPSDGETAEASAQRCGIANTTAFRWRHRFLEASRQYTETLRGILEADETYLFRSRKGDQNMVRPPRRRGGKAKTRGLPKYLAPTLFADATLCYAPCARSLGLSHVALKQSAGPRVRGPYHIQTVGNQQSRFKGFLFHFRGVATKYLGNYILVPVRLPRPERKPVNLP